MNRLLEILGVRRARPVEGERAPTPAPVSRRRYAVEHEPSPEARELIDEGKRSLPIYTP